MWGRRIGYAASVLACFILYIYFNQWAAWVIFWWLLVLPAVSLCMSLPAMKTARFWIDCPQKVTMGQTVEVKLQAQCRFPLPVYKCKLQVLHCMTGQELSCLPGQQLQTDHCGAQRVSAPVVKLYDYMGLFCRKIKTVDSCLVTVMPAAVETAELPRSNTNSSAMRPKRGGGFSEDHDLRQYVQGDDLRLIHWKLTAKTGAPMVRQPLEQLHSDKLLTVVLSGSREQIDRKLGKLLWLSSALLKRKEGHQVAVLNGNGLERFSVADRAQLDSMLQRVLSSGLAAADAAMPDADEGVACFAIGGDADGT